MPEWSQGILTARPSDRASAGRHRPGTSSLNVGDDRDGLMHVPEGIEPGRAAPLLVMLHGAGASSSDVMPMVVDAANQHSVLVVAPDSRGDTWDMLRRGYGPDVEFLDHVLAVVFASYAIAADRIAIGGFSDGASYALSLGLTNGRLFSDILAFSPGFMHPTREENSPRIFISHGREDPVLPIDRCGRRVAATLMRAGFDLDYREFAGGHVVPMDIIEAAFGRLRG